MTDGGQDFNLGHVVGDPGEKGDDGSTVWNTSTAPTYANSKYTFTISNLSGKTGLEIAVNDIIFYSTYYYIVSAVNSTTVDCTTRVNIKGSDASVTIVDNLTTNDATKVLSAKQGKVLNDNKVATSAIATSWGSTLSEAKVPSEKLTKNSLDAKADSSSLATVATTGDYDDLTDKPTIPTKTSDLTNDGDGTNAFLTQHQSLTNYIQKSNTSGLIKNDGTIDTNTYEKTSNKTNSWNSTPNNTRYPTEKLVKDSLDDKLDNRIGSQPEKPLITGENGYIELGEFGTTSGTFAEGNHTHSTYVQKSSTSGLLKNDGTVDTTSYSTFSGSYNDLTNKPSIPSSSSDLSDGSNIVKKSSTSGLLKNDGTVDTTSYSTFSGSYNDLSGKPTIPTKTSDLTNDGDGTNVFVKNNDSRLTDARTPTSHTHGNLTNDGKLGTTSGKPVITTTGGAITTGSFGSTSGTFAEGNHTHSGYVSATKVTSWQSTPSDSNVPSEKLVKDYVDGLIGSAISYIVGSGS